MELNRRNMIQAALFGAGLVGLKSLATGLPISWFQPNSKRAIAATDLNPQFLVLSCSQQGDPLNANCPGSYGVEGVINNRDATMAPLAINLGGKNYQAAKPWAELPAWAQQRMSFFHHRTYSNAHPAHPKVMTLMGSAKSESGSGTETLYSIFSEALSEKLGTIQREPVSLGTRGGGEALTFRGRTLQAIQPTTLKATFAAPTGEFLDLANLRDQALDKLNQELKLTGTHAQKTFVERYALSRAEVKSINSELLDRLASLVDNGPDSQFSAALTLIMMKVAPVITVHLPFGSDNHSDVGLVNEATETVSSLASLGTFLENTKAAGLEDQVTFSTFNVFGRTLIAKNNGNGRDHNQHHHVMVTIGKNVKSGVVGGLVTAGRDFGASDINSVTGLPEEGGDIPHGESMESAGKTLGIALGLDDATLEKRITGGKVVEVILNR